MRIGLRFLVPGAAIAIFSLVLTRSAPVPQAEAASANTLSFRITFGERQELPRDYSGSIRLSSGEVERLSPWRFFDGDEIDGRSGWTLKTKRAQFESQPESEGKVYMMGDAVKARSAPNLKVKILGTGLLTAIDIIKDQTFVYHSEPNKKDVEFSFVDNDPGSGDSYYYVRVQQRDRNLAWSSPIWVDYR